MRNYDYRDKWKKLLTPEILSLLTTIHEYKGEQRLIADRYADVLTNLVDIAKIQSTESLWRKIFFLLTKLKVFIRQMNGLRK